LLLAVSGVLLSLVFVSLSVLIGVVFDDRVKGVSFLLGVWLYLTLLHDGLILAIVYLFRDYPLEKAVLILTMINPVDLARLLIVLNIDVAALMGLSEAVFKSFLGSLWGSALALMTMMLWIFIPSALSLFLFRRKDL
jgi:Cu-processing system permease protein